MRTQVRRPVEIGLSERRRRKPAGEARNGPRAAIDQGYRRTPSDSRCGFLGRLVATVAGRDKFVGPVAPGAEPSLGGAMVKAVFSLETCAASTMDHSN